MAVDGFARHRLISAIGTALDQPELADVARQCRLRHVESGSAQATAQLLLDSSPVPAEPCRERLTDGALSCRMLKVQAYISS
jgi:hypothetical protein